LTNDPDNEDLNKLKADLLEVIGLTETLMQQSQPKAATETSAGESSSVKRSWHEANWKQGDKCRAPWSGDQRYYVAIVDEVLEDGSCSVVFEKYGTTEVTQVYLLRPCDADSEDDDDKDSGRPKSKKDLSLQQREYKKKKAQKKAQRLKQQEDEREQDKDRWVQFNSKVFSKTNKGKVKKSIFASPDTSGGRVGVGTCGVSGKPMTKFTYMEKRTKKN